MSGIANRRELLAAGLGLASAGALPTIAEAEPAAQAYTVPFTSVIPFRSAVNGVAYELYVCVPAEYARTTKTYPVIWTLDADYSFSIACNHVEHLADREHIPNQIIVAIAYAGVYPDVDRYHLERTRDYTPIFAPDDGYGPEIQKVSGGGPKFLEMIEREAMPLIARQFRTDPAQRTLVGHSYGGLFASWVLQSRPDLFDRYLIVSPSLWYLDEWVLKRELAKDYRPMPRPTRVWMSIGSWENQPGRHPMVEQLKRFDQLLAARRDPLLHVESKVIADGTHASIWPAAFSSGLRHLYPTDWQLKAKPSDLGDNCISPPPAA